MANLKSSLEAATEAAARVNALLIAKGKLKLPPTNKIKNQAIAKTSGELYMAEIEINDAPLVARNMLTRGVTQDEINKLSGAAVSTRGRYMTFEDISKNPNERPLYLHVQASTKEAVDAAVDKIHKIIEQQLKATGSTMNWSRSSTTSRTGPTSSASLCLYLGATPTTGHYVQDKLFVGLEHASVAFQLKEKLLGPAELHFNHIKVETGATVSLRGKGSGFLDPNSGREAFEPLHIHLIHSLPKGLQSAKELAVNLIQTIQQEYAQWQQQQTLAVIVQNPASAIGVQQVAIQSGLQQIGVVNPSALGLNVAQEVTDLGVAQTSLQNAQLQLGSVSSNLMQNQALTAAVPSILNPAQGSQLQLIQGQVVNLGSGLASVVPTVVPALVTTSAVNVLPQAQVVYTPTYQHTGQTLVDVSQSYLITQPQVTTTTSAAYHQQQQQLARVAALQTQQAAAHAQAVASTASMYYILPQATTTTTIAQIQSDAQIKTQQLIAQAQNQSRLLSQRVTSTYVQNNTPVTSVAAAPNMMSNLQYRIQSETYNSQKRKLPDDCDMRETYLQRAGRLSMMSVSQSVVPNSNPGYSVYTAGLQSSNPMVRHSAIYGTSSNLPLIRSVDKDHQMMPPPLSSVTLSKAANDPDISRNLDMDAKRLKVGMMWGSSNTNLYRAGSDEDEINSSRHLQRSPIQRYYTNSQVRFGTPVRGEGVWLSGSPSNNNSNSNQASNYLNSGPNPRRYPYQNPFWMAPN